MPRGKTIFYKQGHWGIAFATFITTGTVAVGFAVNAHILLTHVIFAIAWLSGAVSLWITVGYYGAKRWLRTCAASLLGIGMFALDKWTLGYGLVSQEQSRIQSMFSADRVKTLTNVYAVMALDRTYDYSSFKQFCVAIGLFKAFPRATDETIRMIAQGKSKAPSGSRSAIPGILVSVHRTDPKAETITATFAFGYSDGLDRIEIGVFRPDPAIDKFRVLDDLDGAAVSVIATKPLYRALKNFYLVANGYVIAEASDLPWVDATPIDLEMIGSDIRRSQDFVSLRIADLQSIDLAAVVAHRKPRTVTEKIGEGMAYQEINIGRTNLGHGWLLSDAEVSK